MTLPEIEILLFEFDKLPKFSRQPTYLELCRYPRRRFEEICSRLLCFYLAPEKEHGLKDLFLASFLEILSPDNKLHVRFGDVMIINEENSEGKRLDILIHSKDFTIGVENKISANLYNPLSNYRSRIDLYSQDENLNFKVVLSLKKVNKESERKLMADNGFINVTYSDYFAIIRKNIGFYINESNNKYLIYANDFIQTIENMDNINIMNPQMDEFMYDNIEKIEKLVELYNEFDERRFSIQKQRIDTLHELIIQKTGDNKWWKFEGWDLGIYEFNSNKAKIGIESNYEDAKKNPLGKFEIYISTWTLADWKVYEPILLKKFSKSKIEREGNRAYILVKTIENDNEDNIIESLVEIYNYLKELTKEEDSL